MFYAKGENRRKHWYRLFAIGPKKLAVLIGLPVILMLAAFGVFCFYTIRAGEYDLSLVVSNQGAGMLYDSLKEPVATLEGQENPYVGISDLPPVLVNAFIAREDEHFFDHSGIVYSAVLRSVLRNLTSMSYEQGASTITMQLTRNVFELRDKTMDRKLLEAFLAQGIERRYDKQTILCQYLNRIYFGQNCYGISAAAKYYFGKRVKDLDLAESATLAGVVRGPSIFNPVASMAKAREVRAETLQRMLLLKMISQEEFDAAVDSDITLHSGNAADSMSDSSYTTMWVKKELDGIREELGENAGGISVVSNLCLPVQRYLEKAVEKSLQAVEIPQVFPEEWGAFLPPDRAEAVKTAFMKARRPKTLKPRGAADTPENVLQCCAMVVDMRRRSQGNVLAVVSGRSVVDGIDRWNSKIRPGNAISPLVFCCACLPGADDRHIVSNSAEVTGSRIGYEVVRSFFDSLDLDAELPPREQAVDLYKGFFPMKRVDLARVLFSIRNQGRGYKLSMIRSVWNRANRAIYVREPEKAPEYVRRESAISVAALAPFRKEEGKPVEFLVDLPDNNGQWAMVSNDRGVAVFVWMGMDDPSDASAASPVLHSLTATASLMLARDLHAYTRAYLRGGMTEPADAEKEKSNEAEAQKAKAPPAK